MATEKKAPAVKPEKVQVTCSTCDGTGLVGEALCPTCEGHGKV